MWFCGKLLFSSRDKLFPFQQDVHGMLKLSTVCFLGKVRAGVLKGVIHNLSYEL